jgi:hypothetical protein
VTDVTTLRGARTGACVVRAEVDGRTGLRITVTARVDVDELLGERRTVTTSVAAAIARVSEFLEECVRDDGDPLQRSPARRSPST